MILQAAVFGGGDYVMFDWKPEQRTTLHLVNLNTGKVQQFDAPPIFTFHYINTFETRYVHPTISSLLIHLIQAGPHRNC